MPYFILKFMENKDDKVLKCEGEHGRRINHQKSHRGKGQSIVKY